MLIDNKRDRYPDDELSIVTVWDFIHSFSGKESGHTGSLDIVTGYFTIHALAKLAEDMPADMNFRIISSEMTADKRQANKDLLVNLLSDDMDITHIGQIDREAQLAISFLERPTVQMRAEIPDFCHAKAYLFKENKPSSSNYYITGSSNLTPSGIGLKPVPNVELNVAKTVMSNDTDYQELRTWYSDIWNAARKVVHENPDDGQSPMIPVKQFFINKIKEYFRHYEPIEIYYKILYELFSADLNIDDGIEHEKDMGLLQTSVIWRTLFNYQQKGVISLIKMLRKYGGAILADAVGLGKTFSALAVIKYFQLQSYTTVVLCPKKLEQNWVQYQRGAQSRFEKDEFDYQVRFHTDLQNNRLQSGYNRYKLDYLQSRKKLLIVIDESHNLRNEKSSRYKDLLSSLIQSRHADSARDVKVLMLSATPINTGLNDIKGQFNLIAHGNDHAFDIDDFGINSLANLFKAAQKNYTKWCDDPNRTVGSFIRELPPRFFNLTDKLLVARTRSLIENTLGEDLGFPDKEKPINVYQSVDHFGSYKTTEQIYQAFDALTLTAYQPSLFLYNSRREARSEAAADWDDNINRERFLVKMMGILFMKRLESSWFSCKATVDKVLAVHETTLQKVLDFKNNSRDSIIRNGVSEDDEDFENVEMNHREIKVSDIKNLGGFERGLRHDVNLLRSISKGLADFELKFRTGQEKDQKLEELIHLLQLKQKQPNKKVVIFTAYTDTAKFLFQELSRRGFTRMAAATGQVALTTGHQQVSNFNQILQSFAPYSKLYKELDWDSLYDDAKLDPAKYYDEEHGRWQVPFDEWQQLISAHRPATAALLNDPIDILIATDCLSEGQNLQDADLQVNYDIHWNPVRLIQRFGRIDRIGSPNEKVGCVNFWPAKSFEDYLHLESRVMNRMTIMKLADIETPDLNEKFKRMIADNTIHDKNAIRLLEELKNNSISDIESSKTLSLKDFSFETFRQELLEYYNAQRDFYKRMPGGIFSGFVNTAPQFIGLPSSLVALVGYPKKQEHDAGHRYSELYLMCQPVEPTKVATFREVNRAEVLELLRANKDNPRMVPHWVDACDSAKLASLSQVLKQWMLKQRGSQSRLIINDLFASTKTIKQQPKLTVNVDERYQIANFDLIVWEYVTKTSN